MTLKSTIIVAVATAAGLGVPALAQTEISLWHAMAGANNEVIDKIAVGLQRDPVRLQGHAGLQGHLPRDAERRHRRLPRRPGS